MPYYKGAVRVGETYTDKNLHRDGNTHRLSSACPMICLGVMRRLRRGAWQAEMPQGS